MTDDFKKADDLIARLHKYCFFQQVRTGENCGFKEYDFEFLHDFINLQKAEIERLTNKCEDCAGCNQWKCDCSNERAEAVKEFKEKYKDHIKSFTGKFTDEMGFMVNLEAIIFAVDFVADNLVKEMVGEKYD